MNRLYVGRVAIRVVLLICLLILVVGTSTWHRVAYAGIAAAVLFDLVRLLRQGPAAQANLAAARYVEPGEYRVVLQVRGADPVKLIRELRRTTGKRLAEATQIAQDAPAIVVEGLSQDSAAAVVERLQRAGAQAVAVPMETQP